MAHASPSNGAELPGDGGVKDVEALETEGAPAHPQHHWMHRSPVHRFSAPQVMEGNKDAADANEHLSHRHSVLLTRRAEHMLEEVCVCVCVLCCVSSWLCARAHALMTLAAQRR